MISNNIFSDIPDTLPDELFQNILNSGSFRMERIVSDGHSSPDGFWYDQKTSEWVILLQGSAVLLFEGSNKPITMKPGDYILIPSGAKHRVERTDPDQKTVWLAVHF